MGNGRLGALVCGDPAAERLVLCENTLFAGGPYDAVNPKAREALPRIRELIFAGRNQEAHDLAQREFMAQPMVQMPSQTLGNLRIIPLGRGEPSDYRRELDLDQALVRVSYRRGRTQYLREILASAPDRVLALRLSASGPDELDFRLEMDSPHVAWSLVPSASGLRLSGKNGEAVGIPGALAWEASLRLKAPGASIRPEGRALRVQGGQEALIILAMATSYKSWKDVSGDPTEENRGVLDRAGTKDWETLKAAHQADFRSLFRRFSLDLGRGEGDPESLPTAQRLDRASKGAEDPGLAALYLQFARYLLISCSRPGGQPGTLQGLWVDNLWPPWGGKYTININTEMNYWPAEPGNLEPCVEPLSGLVHDLSLSGQRTARALYGARGWVAHHNTDLWRATGPIDGARWGLWPTGGAWLCTHLWERYLFSGDKRVLASDYPVLKGACEFFMDSLVKDPRTGFLVTCPSLSPENAPPDQGDTALCAGPSMDMSILRDLFHQTAEAARILGLDKSFSAELDRKAAHLAPLKIGKTGQLQEWQEDVDLEAPERGHRHVSHLYALHPSAQISPLTTPELAAAARKSLLLRGDEGTGWSLAWKINFWARLLEGERAYRLFQMLLRPERTYPNLFDAHPPFQIDGNFGGAAGIMEMMVQSHLRDRQGRFLIQLLPALPKAWARGSVRGLRARGALTLDLDWEQGRLKKAVFHADRDNEFVVRIGIESLPLKMAAGETRVYKPGEGWGS